MERPLFYSVNMPQVEFQKTVVVAMHLLSFSTCLAYGCVLTEIFFEYSFSQIEALC